MPIQTSTRAIKPDRGLICHKMDLTNIIIRDIAPHELFEVADMWGDMQKEIDEYATPHPKWWMVETEAKLSIRSRSPVRPFALYVVVSPEVGLIGFFDSHYVLDAVCGSHKLLTNDVYIKPDYRRTGLFKTMLDFLKTEAKNTGATYIAGFCKDHKKDFWEKMGFKMTGFTMEMEL